MVGRTGFLTSTLSKCSIFYDQMVRTMQKARTAHESYQQ